MALLFVSNLVPDEPRYRNGAFTRSGNNVLTGIGEALWENGDTEMLGFAPMPSFPRGKLLVPSNEVEFPSGMKISYAPTLNIKALKNLYAGFYSYCWIRKWAKRHKGEELKVLAYNIYDPPVNFLYRACKKAGAKLYVILYDLGVPPERLGLSKLTMLSYRISERAAKRFIPLLDGRIIINENIAKVYAPGKDFLLVDGGISKDIISHLSPLIENSAAECVFVCAGMLWDQNGTRLVLDAMKINSNPKVRVWFAGKGNDVPLIEDAAKRDDRIRYLGMLSLEEIFKVYAEADVLLNLRLEEEQDFHFPSKLLEYMVTGKYVVSTSIAHAERDYGQFLCFLRDSSPAALSRLMDETAAKDKKELLEIGRRSRQFMLENRLWSARTNEILSYMHCKKKSEK